MCELSRRDVFAGGDERVHDLLGGGVFVGDRREQCERVCLVPRRRVLGRLWGDQRERVCPMPRRDVLDSDRRERVCFMHTRRVLGRVRREQCECLCVSAWFVHDKLHHHNFNPSEIVRCLSNRHLLCSSFLVIWCYLGKW